MGISEYFITLLANINVSILSFLSVTDTLDDMLAESGDEEEQDAIMNQVLDEIGVEISGKVMLLHKISIMAQFNKSIFM